MASPDLRPWSPYQVPQNSVAQYTPAENYSTGMDVDGYPSVNYTRSQLYPSGYFDELSDDLSISDSESNIDSTASIVETPSVELEKGNPLLHFSRHSHPFTLLDSSYHAIKISLSAQLNGKFSHALNSAATSAVICYRRNLFSITGNIDVPRNLRYLMTDGAYGAIRSTELIATAYETIERAPVKLILVPFKSAQATGPTKETNPELDPPSIPLTAFNSANSAAKLAPQGLEWKRLQFAKSTLNNGRRRELQQHFIINLNVIATLESGERYSIFETSSEPIVVRGRSPRNFQPKSVQSTSSGRRSRSTTAEASSLALTKTSSASSGSFKPMAMPAVPANYAWYHDMSHNGHPSEGMVARSTSSFDGYYATQESPALPGGAYGQADDDYLSRRSRGSAHMSPRSPHYPVTTNFSGYPQQASSYDYMPSMPSTWSEYDESMYPAPVAPPMATAPKESRSKESRSRTSKTKRHSSGRH